MKGYEKFVNDLLSDEKLRRNFISNPTKTLLDRKLISRKRGLSISLANRLLLYILANKKLATLVRKKMPRPELTEEEVSSIISRLKKQAR